MPLGTNTAFHARPSGDQESFVLSTGKKNLCKWQNSESISYSRGRRNGMVHFSLMCKQDCRKWEEILKSLYKAHCKLIQKSLIFKVLNILPEF